MPASAIKEALLWRSQLHRQTVISFLVPLAILTPHRHAQVHMQQHRKTHKPLQICLHEGRIVTGIYEEFMDKAMHGLNLLRLCVLIACQRATLMMQKALLQ